MLDDFRKQKFADEMHDDPTVGPWLFAGSEIVPILDKLLSDERMKKVWPSLNKRLKDPFEPIRFARVCEYAISGWNFYHKNTASEQAKLFSEIQVCAEKLSKLLQQTTLAGFNVSRAISDENIEFMIREIQGKEGQDNGLAAFRDSLDWCLPSLTEVLSCVQVEAFECSKIGPMVKKPRSENAPVHYFIRCLSMYFNKSLGQPLHESVAVIACVLLDKDDIDSDYVRKLVSN